MKKFTKIFMIAVIAVMSTVACFALSACGGGEAKIKDVFLSPAKLTYMNMRDPSLAGSMGMSPQNYYTTTFTHQELTLNEDGTYCLIVSVSTFSAVVLPETTQDAKGNENDNSIVKYYGTYTSAVNELDEDLLDIKLSKPTRILASQNSEYFVDTANWTDEMGLATKIPSGYDSQGKPTYDPDTPNQTAEGYLKLNAFDEVEAQANTKKALIDFITLKVSK